MPSPSMHREHQVVRRVMTVLDMVMALAGAEIVVDGTFKRRSRSHEIALRRVIHPRTPIWVFHMQRVDRAYLRTR
jgi:hypothetical protein